MPNYCFTQLEVTGPEKDIKRFCDGLNNNITEGNLSILSTYHPRPVDLDVTCYFIVPEGIDDRAAIEATYASNIEKYGHSTWYDWNIANYGSKWADSFSSYEINPHHLSGLSYVRLEFQTAWSPITEGIRFVSSVFPTLVFLMSYEEESDDYVGAEVHKAGETLFYESVVPPETERKDGEDEDEWYDRANDAKLEALDTLTLLANVIAARAIDTHALM